MKSSFYPKADRTKQWWEKDFTRGVFTRIDKILLHTTETTGWPTYSGGQIAPTLTYKPATREWRQHNYLDTSARALGDPASTPVRENRDNVIQIEIIWYAKEIGNLPATAYEDLADFVAYVRKEWGGPALVAAPSGGPNDDVHFPSAQFDAFSGLLGHANAPKPSTHWDPGKFDYAKLIAEVKKVERAGTAVTPPKPAPSTGDTTMALTKADVLNIWTTSMADVIQAPNAADKANPTWTPASFLTWMFRQGTDTQNAVKEVNTKIDALLENQKKIIDLLTVLTGK